MTVADATAKAREILQRQIDATKAHDDSIRQTFTSTAIISTQDKATSAEAVTFFGLADNGPDGTQNDKATIANVAAGGNADAVWFYAEVATESSGPGGRESATTRVVEVAAAAEQWRVVAAWFGQATELTPSADNFEIEGATSADGPLTKLLGSPSAVNAQLAPDAIVVGPKIAVRDAQAREALASWKLEPLTVYKRAREVTTSTWGFAQANLDHPDKQYVDRLTGLIVALPSSHDRWTVVLAAYVHQ
jgi:hypothetical protein